MKNKILMLISLMLFVLVLIGVTTIAPITTKYEFLQPFIPLVVITGFFIFLIAAALFVYGIIISLKK